MALSRALILGVLALTAMLSPCGGDEDIVAAESQGIHVEWMTMDLQRTSPSYLHSPTVHHGMVPQDLALLLCPASVKTLHYTDDVLLTSECLTNGSPFGRHTSIPEGARIGNQLAQGTSPDTMISFLGILCSGTTWMILSMAVEQKQLSIPINTKQLQIFGGLLRYW